MEGVVVLGGSARCYVYTSRGPWGIPEQGTDTPNSLKEPCKAGVSFRGVSCLRPYAAGRGSSKVLRQWSGSQHLIKSQMAAVKCDHNVIIKPRFLCQHLGFGIKLSTKPTAANWAVCALQKRTATSGFAAGRATNLSTWAYWFFWGVGLALICMIQTHRWFCAVQRSPALEIRETHWERCWALKQFWFICKWCHPVRLWTHTW